MANKTNNLLERNNVYLFDYDSQKLEEKFVESINECVPYKNTKTTTWINIDRVPPISFLNELQLGFDLHPVVVEDILNINQRPKIEDLGNYIFLALKMFSFDKKTNKVIPEQVSIVLADNFIMTFQQGIKGDSFQSVREALRKDKSLIRSLGTDYLCYKLIEAVSLSYFDVLEGTGDYIEKLEKEMLRDPDFHILDKIYHIKRQMLELRKSIWPLREAVRSLGEDDSKLIKNSTKIYLRDVYENIVQTIEMIEIHRDILSGMLDVYLSSINNKTNSIIKVLTIITTIFMPISFIAGFYGMNLRYLPGLEYPFAPFVVVSSMIVIFLGMIIFLKIKKWI